VNEVNVGDVGTEIILDCGINILTAFVRSILVEKPDGTTSTWTAAASGMTSIVHVSVEGDFNIPGIYSVQAYIEMPGWKGKGSIGVLEVVE
jgi:hypothetical protein